MLLIFFTLTYITIQQHSHISNKRTPSCMMPPLGFKVAITVSFIFSLIALLPKSGRIVMCDERNENLEEKKMVIGSKPPVCVNKCMNCRPCMATVVINNQPKKGLKSVYSHEEDDSYYLLSWKCRCGNKLFQP